MSKFNFSLKTKEYNKKYISWMNLPPKLPTIKFVAFYLLLEHFHLSESWYYALYFLTTLEVISYFAKRYSYKKVNIFKKFKKLKESKEGEDELEEDNDDGFITNDRLTTAKF